MSFGNGSVFICAIADMYVYVLGMHQNDVIAIKFFRGREMP